jgi:hypothetical protein
MWRKINLKLKDRVTLKKMKNDLCSHSEQVDLPFLQKAHLKGTWKEGKLAALPTTDLMNLKSDKDAI